MSNVFYVTQPVISSGTVTVTIMADAGADVGSADYTINYDSTEATYDTTTGPLGWLTSANGTTAGSVIVAEAGTTAIATSSAQAVGAVTFTPVAGATVLSLSVTLTDWATEDGTEDSSQYDLGTFNVELVQCFAAGTELLTERGAVAVEALSEGDRLATADDARLEPVVWIGRRAVNCQVHPRPEQVWPIQVRAGAFAPGQPKRDLWLSPDHAVFVNDVLVPIKYLVNGTSIAQVKRNTVTYYHVELPRHELVLAEGLAVESYLDVGDRSNFENGGWPVALFPNFTYLKWETEGCAQLIVIGPELESARAVVAARAASIRLQAGSAPKPILHPHHMRPENTVQSA
ncbi:MAG TPA: Hint domain-containing protein [Acetobacteraceae bacterium]|jgi:hypothetical protein